MVSKKALRKLRDQLPTGAASKIQERLANKGIEKSISYIVRVLNPEDVAATSEVILTEAIALRDEYKAHVAEIESRILNPSI
jgi:hypothetical protein